LLNKALASYTEQKNRKECICLPADEELWKIIEELPRY